jgi:hypothetical protein
MAAVAGESEKELLGSGWRTALSISPRYIGTKQPGSGAWNSRSSICFETHNHGKGKTAGGVHR